MRLLWNFIGRASPFADRVQALHIADLQLDADEPAVLLVKGNLVQLRVSCLGETAWIKCAGRRFDFASSDGPVLHIDLELA